MSGTLTITGLSSGEPAGQRTFGPVTITGTGTPDETLAVPLASGDNTFAIPAGSTACWIIPPSNGSASLKVRTSSNSGDTGLPISPSLPFGPFCFTAAVPTSLIINSSGAQSAPLSIVFI